MSSRVSALVRAKQARHNTTYNYDDARRDHNSFWSKLAPKRANRAYAIAFDLDTERLQEIYPTPASWQNAYADIKRIFEKYGFYRQQGSVYFGDDTVDPVKCVLATQDVTNTYSWFRFVVRDIRMLRIEENNDLLPAVEQQPDLI